MGEVHTYFNNKTKMRNIRAVSKLARNKIIGLSALAQKMKKKTPKMNKGLGRY